MEYQHYYTIFLLIIALIQTHNNHQYRKKGLRFEEDFIYAGSPDKAFDEMQLMFTAINEIVGVFEQHGIVKGREKLLPNLTLRQRRAFMNSEYVSKGGNLEMSPLSATGKSSNRICFKLPFAV